jgi:EAL domain-containing protein (putative c-di-GMP-specific phosphodiesterase class I)
MSNIELAATILEQLHELGAQVAIDDFGTGYSSLGHLAQLPVDVLKIDRSFVSRMDREDGQAELVRTIAALGHRLGLTVIAEGVETEEQRTKLLALGCEYAQGYLISRAMPAEAAAAFIVDAQRTGRTT